MRASRSLMYRPMKGQLQTKKSVSKRFRVSSRGLVKCWPSQNKGKKKLMRQKGNARHMAELMPYTKGRSRWVGEERPEFHKFDILQSAQRAFQKHKGREMSPKEIEVVADMISRARVVGNRVYPAKGESVLKTLQ